MDTDVKRANRRSWNLAHPEQVRAHKKAWYAKYRLRELVTRKARYTANKARILAERRERYAAERDARRALAREKYAANPTQRLSNNRRYRAARLDEFRERDKHYSKAWQANHYARFRAISRRSNQTRRAVKLAAFVEGVDPLTVFGRDRGTCGICHHKIDPDSTWHVDHVIPLSKGGVHSYDNVQLAHARCNLSKQSQMPTGQLGLFQKFVVGGRR